MTEVNYISTKEAARILGLSVRRVVGLCNTGKLEGAVRNGHSWIVPEKTIYVYKGCVQHEKMGEDVLTIAAGNTSYKDMVKNSWYADKTLLIRDIIDDRVPVIVFARPDGFGKTLNLNMIRTFFEKTEEDTYVYFKDKKIRECGEKYMKLQGTFPVISLTFKDTAFSDRENTYTAVKNVIREEYMRHGELFTSDRKNSLEKEYLEKILSGELNDAEYTRAILNLSRMLEKHHGSRVVILIDDYDIPVKKSYLKPYGNEVTDFMANLLSSGLKDNTSLAYGVLTGTVCPGDKKLFGGIADTVINFVTDEKYSEYFGFTHDEVKEMTAYYECEDKIDEIREWYGGYRFGKTDIYDPWSVSSYMFNECKTGAYRINRTDDSIIHELTEHLTAEITETVMNLLQGNSIQISLNRNVLLPQIAEGSDTLFSSLLNTGFVSNAADIKETEFGSFSDIYLPNIEIRRAFSIIILSAIRKKADGDILAGLEKAVFMNDGKQLMDSFKKYIQNCISSFAETSEGFYHSMMLGLAAVLSSCYEIKSKESSGELRFEFALIPKTDSMLGIIIKGKQAKYYAGLTAYAAETLKQIEDKQYMTEMKKHGACEMVKFGAAYYGKNAEISKS